MKSENGVEQQPDLDQPRSGTDHEAAVSERGQPFLKGTPNER
jgi:hypothetical protein